MSAYGTKIAEAYSQKVMGEFYDRNLGMMVVNTDYEGEINAVGSKVNILNFDRLSEKTYTGSNLSVDDITENAITMTIDQYKSFYHREKTLDRWLSFIKNPHATIVTQQANERMKNVDTFIFGKYSDVGAGHRVGTDYTTGTVTIDSSGNVTGSGTTFTSAMVGKGFKADGHTTWYRVASYSGATAITIEDDLDDVSSQYTGGAIAGGSTYTIEAATVLTITTSNLLNKVAMLKQKLDTAEKNGYNSVPDTGRKLIVPPEFETTLIQANGVALHVPEAYQDLVKRGFIGQLQGFDVYKSNRLTGDNTDGYHVLALHPMWMTFAEKLLEVGMEDLIGNFGKAYKDLFVYGAKVADPRRHMAAEGFWKFA